MEAQACGVSKLSCVREPTPQVGFLLDMSLLDCMPESAYCGRDSVFAFDRSVAREIHVPVIEHERCIYCRHDVAVEERCGNCGAHAGDRHW